MNLNLINMMKNLKNNKKLENNFAGNNILNNNSHLGGEN
jgi:hypothetical protein